MSEHTPLTEAEREALWEAIERAFLDTTTWSKAAEDEIEHTVERILTDRTSTATAGLHPCSGCGLELDGDDPNDTGPTWDCVNFTEPATCLSAGVTETARCARCRLRLLMAQETVRLAAASTTEDQDGHP